MSFVNPDTIRKIFAGTPVGQQGAFDPNTHQGQNMIAMLAGAGSGMTQAAGQPGAGFAQAMGGGAQGMMQGQQHAQQQQMGQMQMQQMQQQLERQERISKILGDLTGSRRPDFASQVDAQLPQAPSLTQPQQGQAQTSPLQGRGQISAQYESGSGGVGTVSSGQGDPGGISYGTHQLSSNAGTMQSFLQSPEGQPFATQFGDLAPGSPQFNQVYQEVVQGAGPQLEQAQQQFLERTHVQPVVEMAQKAGLPVDNPAVQEALYSQAIQHSGQGNMEIINRAMASLGSGAGPEQVIDALYDAREPYAIRALERDGADPDVIEGVRNRYRQERNQVKAALGERVVQPGGGPGPLAQGQPQQAPQQPQQTMNGYQQTMAQRAQEGSIPPQAAELLSLMDPDQAIKALWDMQNPKQQDMPAAVKELMWAFGGDEQAARQAWHDAEQAKAQQDKESAPERDIRLFMEAHPDATRAQAIEAVQSNRYDYFVDPLQGTMQRDKITNEVTPVRPEYGPVEFDPERDVPDMNDPQVAKALGLPGFGRNIANTVAGFFNADELPEQEAERARAMLNNLATRATAAFSLQLPGRASNMQLEMGERLQVRPGQPTMSPARAREVFDAGIRDMKAELDRINRDILDQPGYSASVYSDARANASQIRRILGETTALRNAIATDSQQAQGPDDDDLDEILRIYGVE